MCSLCAPDLASVRGTTAHIGASVVFDTGLGSGAGRDRPEAACPSGGRAAAGAADGFNAVQKLLTAWGTRLGECRPLALGLTGA